MLKGNSGHWLCIQRRQCLLQAVMTEVSGIQVPIDPSLASFSNLISRGLIVSPMNSIFQVVEHVRYDAASKN